MSDTILDRAKEIAVHNYLAKAHSFNVGLFALIEIFDPEWKMDEYLARRKIEQQS